MFVLNNLAQIGIIEGRKTSPPCFQFSAFAIFWGGLVEELYQNILSGE